MTRITQQHLQAVCDRINAATGMPAAPWEKDIDGKWRAQIGNYHLSGAYGGVSLHRMVSDGGGVSDVFDCGYVPKRHLADRMHAFLRGIESKQTV